MNDIKSNNFKPYERRRFRGALTYRKLSGISVMNAMGTILKKVNVSFIVNFCLGKYVSNLDTFCNTSSEIDKHDIDMASLKSDVYDTWNDISGWALFYYTL